MDTSTNENFFNREEELAKLDLDVRVEKIRQSSLKYSFDHFQQVLRKSMKEKKVEIKQDERVDLQKAISCLKKFQTDDLSGEQSADSNNGSFGLYNAVKELGSLLGCEFEARGSFLRLKHEDFVMEIGVDGPLVVQCNTLWFNTPGNSSVLLKNHMNEGRWREVTAGLQKIFKILPKTLNSDQRRLCMMSLSHVESDLYRLSTMPHQDWNSTEKYALEHCHPRTDLSPFTILLGIEPFMQPFITQIKDSVRVQESVLYSVQLGVAPSDVVMNLPLEPLLNEQMRWNDITVGNPLPAVFSLSLSRPLAVSSKCFEVIRSLELINIDVKEHVNLYKYLANVTGVKNLHSTLASDLVQLFDLDISMLEKTEDVVVTEFTFVHPKDVTKLLKLLKDQLIFNNLFESLCRVEPSGQKASSSERKVLQVRVDSKKAFAYDLFFDYGNMVFATHFRVNNGKIKLTIDTSSEQPLNPNTSQKLQDAINRTWSIPITLHYAISQLKEQFGDLLINSNAKLGDFVYDNFMVDKIQQSIGASWLRVFEMSKMPRDKTETIHSYVAATRRSTNKPSSDSSKPDRLIFSAKPKKDKSSSLLSILREVEEFDELIPPNPPPIVPRTVVIPRLSMEAASRTVRSSTDTAYHNAFSDLEAIAEMGASIDDAESVISESGRSSIADRYSPSGSADPHRNFRMETTESLRSTSASFSSAQISPMEAQKGIYRQRFMQAGMSQQNMGKGADVFDFVPDDVRMHQLAHGMPPSFDDQGQPFNMPMGPASASYAQSSTSGYSPLNSSMIPNSAPITGSNMNPMMPYMQQMPRRRGRARKVGNMGERQPSREDPDSPSLSDRMMNVSAMFDGKKQRGGTGMRRPRRPRKTPSTVGEQNFSYQMNEEGRPMLQRSFSEFTTSYKHPAYDEPKMLTENDILDDSSDDEETDPPRYMQPPPVQDSQSIARNKETSTPTTAHEAQTTSDQGSKNLSTTVKKLSVAYSSSTSSASEKTSPSPPIMSDYSSMRGGTLLMQKPSSSTTVTTKESITTTTTSSSIPAPKKPEEPRARVRSREAPSKPIQTLRQSISSSEESSEESSDEEEFPVLKPAVKPEAKIRKMSVDPVAANKSSKTNVDDLHTNDAESEARKLSIKKNQQPSLQKTSTPVDSSTASPTSATKVVLRLPKLKPSGAGSSSTSKTSAASSTPTEPIARLSSGAPPSRKATSTFKTSEGRATPSSQSSIKHKPLGATLASEEKRANKRKGDTRSSQGSAKEAKIPKKSPAEPPTTFPPTPQTLGFTTVGMASLKNFKIPKVQEDKPESPVTTVPPPSVTTTSATSSQESRPTAEPRDNIRPSQPPNPPGHFQQFPFNPPSNLGLPSSNFNIRRPAQPRSILKNAPPSHVPPDFGNPNMPPYRATTPTQQRKPFVNEPPPRGSFRGQPPVARPPNFNPPPREKSLSMGVGGWMPLLNPQQPYQTSSKERPNYTSQPVERDKSDQFSREVKDDSPSEQLQIDESE